MMDLPYEDLFQHKVQNVIVMATATVFYLYLCGQTFKMLTL